MMPGLEGDWGLELKCMPLSERLYRRLNIFLTETFIKGFLIHQIDIQLIIGEEGGGWRPL